MNKYEYLDRIVEYMNNIILEYKDIKSITIIGNNIKYEKKEKQIIVFKAALCGIEIIFHNNDLADKFAKSLNPFHISYVKNGNKITISHN